MRIATVKLAGFSPTGTTTAVLQGMADGLNASAVEHIDLTRPEIRDTPLHTGQDDLLLIGVPVYMGRVPALLEKWLDNLQADNTPAVCVVLYGNRDYENALLELRDIVSKRGARPIGGAAFIGEHSFGVQGVEIAQGRPNADDLKLAESFGKDVREKLSTLDGPDAIGELTVRGEYPYAGRTQIWDLDFIAVDDSCTQCGLCAEVCPMEAVDPDNSANIDIVKCISCCACIKQCPQQARTVKEGPIIEAQKRLTTLFSEPKQPECFL